MENNYLIILFYKFFDCADPAGLAKEQRQLAETCGLTGRALIAKEGINATFEGTRKQIEQYKAAMHSDERFSDIFFKESAGTGNAFPKLVVKVRDEIVTLGASALDIKNDTATELPAEVLEQWYENKEDFVVLDLRNNYEIDCGKFEKTINPQLENFRDLPDKLNEIKNNPNLQNKKIVTVCTGGIRCEKATALMKQRGFKNLYQLKDGIHTYLQKFPGRFFRGTLFVFDNRVTTDVVPTPNKKIIGQCTYCGTKTERYANDDSVKPSRKLLCCESCYATHQEALRAMVAA